MRTKPHAPTAPGPRPNTWYKKTSEFRHPQSNGTHVTTFTAPDPARQNLRTPSIYSHKTVARQRAKTLNRS